MPSEMNYVESGSGILTVRQLRAMLEGLDPETHVLVGTDTWFNNVAGLQLPEEDGPLCVTFVQGEPYDTRQQ